VTRLFLLAPEYIYSGENFYSQHAAPVNAGMKGFINNLCFVGGESVCMYVYIYIISPAGSWREHGGNMLLFATRPTSSRR
jgi:hypothetical protein